MVENKKTYQVDYLITVKDQASEALSGMANSVTKMAEPLKEFQKNIATIPNELRKIQEGWNGVFKIMPELDTAKASEQLQKLENLAKKSANNISTILGRALAGKSQKKQTKAEIQKAIDSRKAQIKAGTLDKNSIKLLEKEIQEYNEQLQNIGRRKTTKPVARALAGLPEFAQEHEGLKSAASAVRSLRTSLDGFKSKTVKIKIGADTTQAMTAYNTLLATIRETVASVPVTLTKAAQKANNGKTKGGTATDAKTKIKKFTEDDATKLVKEYAKKQGSINIPVKLEAGAIAEDYAKVAADLKEKAGSLMLKVTLDTATVTEQLTKLIETLQALADKKPIVVKASASSSSETKQEKEKSVSTNTTTATAATKAAGTKSKGETMSEVEARGLRNANNGYELYKLNKYNEAQEAAKKAAAMREKAERISGASANLGGGSIGSAIPKRTAAQPNTYAKMKQFWYPLTGNSSFGARVPMAVDMAKGMGSMFAIGGAMSAVGSSLSQSVNYQNIMATTKAILENGTKNYSDGGFKEMENTVRQVGKETKFTAPQVASAAKFLAMAGYDIPAIKSAINPVANIALIGDTNLGETADKLTNVMTTFGINPEKMSDIADIMTTTFTRSNTDMMMLAESAKYAGGIANLYGGSFQNNFSDVMAMFGILGNAGIQASSAGTTLRMMYQNLMQPNKNQNKYLQHYGITTRDASGAPLEMIKILKQIYAKVPQAQLADAVGNMFRITAQPGASTLIQSIGTGKLVELMEANRNSAGTGVAQSIADEKKNTLSGLWAQVESTFTEGILQALEGRQGGWAKMLMDLRDYLARPETVKMLNDIVDLVENLMRIMRDFAQLYAQIYHTFPNIISFWMRFQVWMTQIGYFITPLIQLSGVLNMLSKGINGVTAAVTTATVAEKARLVAIGGGAANLLGGAASGVAGRTAATRSSGLLGGLVAANIAGGITPYRARVKYKELVGYVPRADILGPLSLTKPQYYSNQPAIIEESKIWERSRGYGWGSFTKKQKRQANETINRKLAEIRAKHSGIYYPSVIPLNFGFGAKPIYKTGRTWGNGVYNRAAVSQVMPFHKYASRTGSVLNGGAVLADNAAAYRWRSQKWGSISANQSLSAEQRALAAVRSEKYLNAAIEVEMLRQQSMIAQQNAQQNAQRAHIAQIAAARHANRGPIDSAVRNRFAQRYGFKKTAGMAWKNSFSAGRAMGALNIASMAGGIKSMALSLFSGLAKAIGLLVSPIGLAVTAIAALGYIGYKVYQKYKQYKANIKLADDNRKRIVQQQKDAANLYDETGNKVYNRKPLNIELPKVEQDSKKLKQTYSLADNPIVSTLLNEEKTKGVSREDILNKYIVPSKYLPWQYYNGTEDSYSKIYSSTTGRSNDLDEEKWGKMKDAEVFDSARSQKEVSKDELIKRGVVTQWADLAIKQSNVKEALVQIQTALKDHKFNLAQRILASYKPVTTMSMLTGRDAKAISQIQDPTKFYEWQYAQYTFLKNAMSLGGVSGKYSHALDLINEYKGLDKKGKSDYDGTRLAQNLLQSVPLVINGTKASISLDKMGRIDWTALANTVNNRIPFSYEQQIEIMSDVYKTIYNDPNVKNTASVIELLQLWLPQIANVQPESVPYWTDWGEETPSEMAKKREENTKHIMQIPLADAPLGALTPTWGAPGTMYDVSQVHVPRLVNDLTESIKMNGGHFVQGEAAWRTKRTAAATNTNNTSKGNSSISPIDKNQKDYKSTYDRNAARPTQVIINIDKLANFDRTAISKDSNDRAITEAIETKITEAVSMLSAQILTSASSTISQGI